MSIIIPLFSKLFLQRPIVFAVAGGSQFKQ